MLPQCNPEIARSGRFSGQDIAPFRLGRLPVTRNLATLPALGEKRPACAILTEWRNRVTAEKYRAMRLSVT